MKDIHRDCGIRHFRKNSHAKDFFVILECLFISGSKAISTSSFTTKIMLKRRKMNVFVVL